MVRTSVTHSAITSCATYLFLPHFDVICDLLLNRLTATWNLFVNAMMMVGYCDADWVSSTDYRRSTSGYCFSLDKAGPLISRKWRKQPTVALSSCEAEYIALSAAVLKGLCHSKKSSNSTYYRQIIKKTRSFISKYVDRKAHLLSSNCNSEQLENIQTLTSRGFAIYDGRH